MNTCTNDLTAHQIKCSPHIEKHTALGGIQYNPIDGSVYDNDFKFLGYGIFVFAEDGESGTMNVYDTKEEFEKELIKTNNQQIKTKWLDKLTAK
jgi:hypothetical protein